MSDFQQIRDALENCKLKLQHSTYEPATHQEIDHVTSWNRGVDACIAILDRMMAARGDTQAALQDWEVLLSEISRNGTALDNDALDTLDGTIRAALTAQPAESVGDVPILTGDIKVGVTTFRKGVKLSTVQSCIDSHINNPPRISGDTNLLEDLAKNMRSGSVEYYSEPKQPDVNAELLGALKEARDQYVDANSVAYPEEKEQWPLLLKMEKAIANAEQQQPANAEIDLDNAREVFENWLTGNGDYPHLNHKSFGGQYLHEEAAMKWDGFKAGYYARAEQKGGV